MQENISALHKTIWKRECEESILHLCQYSYFDSAHSLLILNEIIDYHLPWSFEEDKPYVDAMLAKMVDYCCIWGTDSAFALLRYICANTEFNSRDLSNFMMFCRSHGNYNLCEWFLKKYHIDKQIFEHGELCFEELKDIIFSENHTVLKFALASLSDDDVRKLNANILIEAYDDGHKQSVEIVKSFLQKEAKSIVE